MTTLAVPYTYGGVATCIRSASFGKLHGTSAATGSITLDGVINNIRLGSTKSIMIGSSVYFGYVSSFQHDLIEQTTTLKLADWRDALHDHWIFGAYNMQERDGRIWHLFIHNWEDNIVTPVTKELDQLDFSRLQNTTDWSALKILAGERLVSAAEILNFLSNGPISFSWTAEPDAMTILKKSRPMNISFQNGSKVADAIQSVLSACGLQFTVRIPGQLYITLKGFSSNLFVNGILDESVDLCVLDPDGYIVGREISQKGRRVTVVGKRNKHQYIFPCKPDWNPNWTWQLCYGGWVLSALLRKNGLWFDDKLKDMPEKYQDSSHWHEDHEYEGAGHVVKKRTRNDLTIREYLDKVVFRIYAIDFSKVVAHAKYGQIDKATITTVPFHKWIPTGWLDLYNAAINRDPMPSGPGIPTDPPPLTRLNDLYLKESITQEEITCPFPPSETLVTDSNMQCVALATSRKITNGVRNPFTDQRTLVPMKEGYSLEVENKIVSMKYRERDEDGNLTMKIKQKNQMAYSVRLVFSEPRFIIDRDVPFTDAKSIKPDYVCCVLSLDGTVYQYTKGDMSNTARVRAQKVDVDELHRASVNDKGVTVLADNLKLELEEGGSIPAVIPAKADDIADKIATQALFHLAINKTGSISFSRAVGFECDGLIDTVQVNIDEDSVTENVQMTDGWLDGESRQAPIELGLSAKTKFEGKLVIDRLKALASMASRAGRGRATAMPPPGVVMQTPGSVYNPAAVSRAFSGGSLMQGTAAIKVGKSYVLADEDTGLSVSQVMIYGKLKEMEDVDDS